MRRDMHAQRENSDVAAKHAPCAAGLSEMKRDESAVALQQHLGRLGEERVRSVRELGKWPCY